MDRGLYEASLSGSVAALNKLMQQDELILDRASVTCFHETPLHIAAMRGHVDFTQVLLSQKPKLTTELDSFGHSPLHLASAEGHVEIVRDLLCINSDVCHARDQDGRTPLHLAAIKGRVGVLEELTQSRHELAYERVGRGETVLHLCVRYYRLEALKYLVEFIKNEEFVNSKDHDGNTILHLAAIFKQMETIEYLFSREEVKENANAKNANGFTALDVLDHCPRDVKVMEIREFLLKAGVQRAINHGTDVKVPLSRNVSISMPPTSTEVVIRGSCMNFLKKAWRFICVIWKKYLKINNEWLEEARGNLMIVATVTASMSFQAGVNPPGSVWQDYTEKDKKAIPGIAIMDTKYPDDFKLFLKCNTVSLVASLSIILLMISGFPLTNKLSMWLLIAAMSSAVISMQLTYVESIKLITWENYLVAVRMSTVAVRIWMVLCGIILLINSINILVWVVKMLRKFLIRKRCRMARVNE